MGADESTLVYRSAKRVDAEITLGSFLAGQITPQLNAGVTLDADTLDALTTEVWHSDANTHLQRDAAAGGRPHQPSSDTKTSSLQLFPDEWIYLPVMEAASPDWQLQSVAVDTDDVGKACSLIGTWAVENKFLLPMSGPTAPDAPPSIDPDTLKSYLLNSAFRQGLLAKNAFVYVTSPSAVTVDAAPTTPAGGVSPAPARATPAWLVPFWQYIDRMVDQAQQHRQAFEALHTILVEGKLVFGLTDLIDRVMSLMEREMAPPPPSPGVLGAMADGFAAGFSPDHGMRQNIADVHAKVRALRTAAKQDLVDNPTFPEIKQFDASLARLEALAQEPAFLQLYQAFDAERANYPQTETAFQIATAAYIDAWVLNPNAGDVISAVVDAYLQGKPGKSPITKEVAKVFNQPPRKYADDAAAIIALTAGNAPGPPTLWVTVTKLAFVAEIQKIAVDPKAPRRGNPRVLKDYMKKLVYASGVAEEVLEEWEADQPKSRMPPTVARAVARRMTATDEVVGRTQSGSGAMLGLSLLNLWAIYSAIATGFDDAGEANEAENADEYVKKWLNVVGDAAGGSSALLGLSADVAKIALNRVTAKAAVATAPLLKEALEKQIVALGELAGRFGFYVGFLGTATAVFQLYKSSKQQDTWGKVAAWGNLAAAVGYWVDVIVSRYGVTIAVRLGLAEVGALAVGEAVLLTLGSVLTVVGILVTVVAIAATHWDDIMRVAYALFAPGTQKFVDTFLNQVGACRVVAIGPASVRSALAAAIDASSHAGYVTWSAPARVDDELRGLGLNDSDIKLLKSIPTPVGGAPMGP